MPTEPEAVEVFLEAKILYGPGKAANAGGVAVSGLEMAQNSQLHKWPREDVDAACTASCVRSTRTASSTARTARAFVNYVNGANIAGFVKVADAMLAQGVV